MLDLLTDPQTWAALATLTALEVVLGIDNIIFISIMTSRLPPADRHRARTLGLMLAMLMRIGLLLSLAWMMRLTEPLFTVLGNAISGRDAILIVGGLFLLGKSTLEIHEKLEGEEADAAGEAGPGRAGVSFAGVLVQVMLLDIVFSLDSVITAIGMANRIEVMVAAVVMAVGFMLFSARAVGDFVERHPTVRMLALSFLLLIGLALVADGLDMHIPKGYIYFSMGFSVFVEMLNLKIRTRRAAPVQLRRTPHEG
jgi:predicted tellurium resistance membrane protein TerC